MQTEGKEGAQHNLVLVLRLYIIGEDVGNLGPWYSMQRWETKVGKLMGRGVKNFKITVEVQYGRAGHNIRENETKVCQTGGGKIKNWRMTKLSKWKTGREEQLIELGKKRKIGEGHK